MVKDVRNIDELRELYIEAQAKLGNILPHLVLACAGGSDEHWQIWDSDELYFGAQNKSEVFPVYIIEDGKLVPHPDGKFGTIEE